MEFLFQNTWLTIATALVIGAGLGYIWGLTRKRMRRGHVVEDDDPPLRRIPHEVWQVVDVQLAQGRPDLAIRLYREATGAGLKEAEHAVELRQMKMNFPGEAPEA